MKFGNIFLLATASCAKAAWLRWSVNRDAVWAARETKAADGTERPIGWSPIPTPAPGLRTPEEEVLELLRRATDSGSSSSTDWEASNTCGWFSGISSSAVACGGGFTCATNSEHVVACASGTVSPFYTACLDFSAFQAGSCSSVGAKTGCCQNSEQPACGTYIWTGSPERYMYKCFETASVLSILDVPQFVIDASIFSKTHTTPTPTIASSDPTATDGSPTSGTTGQAGGTGGPGASGSDSGSSGTENGTPGATSSKTSSTNTPVVVGGAVGGGVGLLLLLLLLFLLKRKMKGKLGLGFSSNKKNKTKTETNSTTTYNMNNMPASKGRNSSVSEATTAAGAVAAPAQEHHYHHQDHHHYSPQVVPQQQQMHQTQAPGVANPSVVSYTVNNTSTSPSRYPGSVSHTINNTDYSTIQHSRQPSLSERSTTGPAPSTTGSTFQPHFLAGGLASTQPQQTQNPNVPTQLQPVNHIHVYYAPPISRPEPSRSRSPPVAASDAGFAVHNHIHHTQADPNQSHDSVYSYYDRDQSRSRTRDESRQPRTGQRDAERAVGGGGQHRDASAVSPMTRGSRSPSPEVLDEEWNKAAGGPGFRQSM